MENKSSKFWKIFAVILIALNITLIVFLLMRPFGNRHPGAKEEGAPGKYLTEKLKFNAQQEAEFTKLRTAHHDSIEALKDEGKKLRKSFFDGLKTDATLSFKDSLSEKIAKNQKRIELVTYNHFEAVKKLCTPEQKIIFNDIIQELVENLGRPAPMRGER